MQSQLTKLLIDEHNFIQRACEFVYSLENTWMGNSQNYEQSIKNLIHFFSEYADGYHHKKEEEILFRNLSLMNDTVCVEIVSELLDQHETFRFTLQKIKNSLDEKDYESVQKYFEEYIDLLKDHIAMEDDEVFPMSDSLFNDDELDKLYYRCIDKDNEIGFKQKKLLEDFIKKFKTETDGSIR